MAHESIPTLLCLSILMDIHEGFSHISHLLSFRVLFSHKRAIDNNPHPHYFASPTLRFVKWLFVTSYISFYNKKKNQTQNKKTVGENLNPERHSQFNIKISEHCKLMSFTVQTYK